MSTFLWEDIVFGPIRSRRVGNSLGINLMPTKGKICTFDCIYCECGLNSDGKGNSHIPSYQEVANALEARFKALFEANEIIDSISFTGNGEPTIHPSFPAIIDLTIALRDKYLPSARISVFSNATMIHKAEIRDALMKVEYPILKLDAASEELVNIINQPTGKYDIEQIISDMQQFNGNFVMQSMFLSGSNKGKTFDNCSAENVAEWREIVLKLRPKRVMIYSFERETPVKTLQKASVAKMHEIAAPLVAAGIDVQING
ncbi:MAG: radical SAM protein [Bacteroidales bacterium]|nr:radical SAM protein [Bacteroidales bacterium]